MPDKSREHAILVNRKALANFELEESKEAGIILFGSEVKSLREGKVSFEGSYCEVKDGEIWLNGLTIARYRTSSIFSLKEDRPRKLLLHKREIDRLAGKMSQKGYTLIPIKIYFKGSWVKISIALGKGKKRYDKREEIKKRETLREISRLLKGQET
ncbi:MAG: SsrA-binding protein [candidate division WS2 bacterium]|nr:SsrA-binding protein [Candidatus Lithacetigena glycinireducens]